MLQVKLGGYVLEARSRAAQRNLLEIVTARCANSTDKDGSQCALMQEHQRLRYEWAAGLRLQLRT